MSSLKYFTQEMRAYPDEPRWVIRADEKGDYATYETLHESGYEVVARNLGYGTSNPLNRARIAVRKTGEKGERNFGGESVMTTFELREAMKTSRKNPANLFEKAKKPFKFNKSVKKREENRRKWISKRFDEIVKTTPTWVTSDFRMLTRIRQEAAEESVRKIKN